MKSKKFISILLVVVFVFTIFNVIGLLKPTPVEAAFTNFITRDPIAKDKLMDGASEFRFIAVNCPILHAIDEPVFEVADPFETEDAIKAVAQMGGTVVRDYVISVRKATDTADIAAKKMVANPNTFNEVPFRALDKVLQLCNQYGIRVIIPFTDPYEFFGGIPQYEAFRNKPGQFFTDAQLRQDFKDTINYVVNRVNYYTGVRYKDDKAILAWETGNEVAGTDEWCSDIAAYIKSIDPNHLVIDGKYNGIRTSSLTDPNIDIVSNHYYPWVQGSDFAAYCNNDRNTAIGQKVFIVGEFGCNTTAAYHSMLDAVISNGTSGALLWALRPHKRVGGFYFHQETGAYWDYHWPGFASGSGYDETNVLNLIRDHSYQIRGLSVPARTIPDAPVMLPISSTSSISWQGSAGAEKYDIERATSAGGPWTNVGTDVLDSTNPYQPFNDTSAVGGQSYYYRVKAKNIAGASSPSNVVGPVSASGQIVDEMNDFTKMHSYTANLAFDSSSSTYFNGDTSRLKRTTSTYENIVYNTTGDMTSFEVDTYFWPYEPVVDLKLYTSSDGSNYTELTPVKNNLGGDWTRIKYTSSSIPAGTRYLKIEFRNTSANYWNPQISRLTINYN